METLEQLLRQHGERYPQMQPADAVKLLYQNEFGGGHLIRDPEACLRALAQEYQITPPEPSKPLLEDIGNGMVRVMLAALDKDHIAPLGEAFIRSAREHSGTLGSFLGKLETLRRVTAAGAFGFSSEDLEAYLKDYQKAGYPMVSHSGQYRAAYRPAYRVLQKQALPESLI